GDAKDVLAGRAVGERAISVRTGVPMAELKDCEIAFISAIQAPPLRAVLFAVQGRPVLTVADTPGFAEQGVIVNFYRAGDRLRFEINLDAARRARLTISSRLLSLARIVHDAPPPPP